MMRFLIPIVFLAFIVSVIFLIPAYAHHEPIGKTFTGAVTKQTDEIVNNSVALQNDDELKVTLEANNAYQFDLRFYIDTTGSADFQYLIDVPTGSTVEIIDVSWEPDFPNDMIDGSIAQSLSMGGSTTSESIQVTGRIITAGTAGDATIQWAQNFAQDYDTKLLAGSSFVVRGDSSLVKQSTETVNNSDTLQNDNDFFVALEANKSYSFDMMLFLVSGGTPDFKYAFTVPTGATIRINDIRWEPDFPYDTLDGTVADVIPTNGNTQSVQVTGHIDVAGTAGDVQMQWAQNFAEVSNTQLLAGSSFVVLEENHKVKQSDETVNSSTQLQDDDELFFTLEPNTAYSYDARLYVETADNADFKWAFNVPSGTIVEVNDQQWEPDFPYDTLDATTAQQPNFGGGTDESLQLTGRIVTGSEGGTLQFQWAQKTAQGSNTILNSGSSLTLNQEETIVADAPNVPYWVQIKTVDETVNNVWQLQQDDELRFPVEANSAYEYEMRLFASSTSSADFGYAFDVPDGTTINVSTTDWQTDNGFLPNDATQQSDPSMINGETAIHVNGRIVTAGTAGDVILKWAQSSAQVTDTTVKAGSNIHVYGGDFSTVKQTSQTITRHPDLIKDDDLVVALEPNYHYPFELRVFVDSHATPDFKYDIQVPDGTSIDFLRDAWDPDNTNWVIDETWYPIQSSMGSSEEAWMTHGIITTGSNGGVAQLRWSQTNESTETTILHAGTALTVYEGIPVGGTVPDNPMIVVKGIPEIVNNSNVVQDDDQLSVTLNPNTVYGMETRFVVATTSTPDFKYNYDVPSGSIAKNNRDTWAQGSTFGTRDMTEQVGATGGSGNQGVQVHGYLVTGSVQEPISVNWAQDTATAEDTTLLGGTYMMILEQTKRLSCDSTTSNSANLSHNDDLSPNLVGYGYRYSLDDSSWTTVTENSGTTDSSYIVTDLNQNKLYYFQYQPVYTTGGSGWSESVSCSTEQGGGGGTPDPEPTCEELDSDFDFINDCNDLCPDQPENRNFFQDEDGCPDDDTPLIPILNNHLFQAFGNTITTLPNSFVDNQDIMIQWNNPDDIIAQRVEMSPSPFDFTFETLPIVKKGSGLPLSQNHIAYNVQIPNTCTGAVTNECVQLVRYEVPATVYGVINGTSVSDETEIIIDLSDDAFNPALLLLWLLLLIPILGVAYRRRKKKKPYLARNALR